MSVVVHECIIGQEAAGCMTLDVALYPLLLDKFLDCPRAVAMTLIMLSLRLNCTAGYSPVCQAAEGHNPRGLPSVLRLWGVRFSFM